MMEKFIYMMTFFKILKLLPWGENIWKSIFIKQKSSVFIWIDPGIFYLADQNSEKASGTGLLPYLLDLK